MTFSKATLLLSLLVVFPVIAAELEWQAAQPEYSWSFPQDHWAPKRISKPSGGISPAT